MISGLSTFLASTTELKPQALTLLHQHSSGEYLTLFYERSDTHHMSCAPNLVRSFRNSKVCREIDSCARMQYLIYVAGASLSSQLAKWGTNEADCTDIVWDEGVLQQ